jgi:hypothetical protein
MESGQVEGLFESGQGLGLLESGQGLGLLEPGQGVGQSGPMQVVRWADFGQVVCQVLGPAGLLGPRGLG